MLFAFFPFLFLFLPILVWLWKLTSGEDKARLSVLLLGASLLFGACQGLEALLLLLGLTVVNYLFGLLLADEGHRRRRLGRRGLLLLAVLLNVLVWCRFRHLPALSAWLAQWQDILPVLAPAAMPAGFSFAVLIQLAWLLGVYQRRIRPEGIVRQALFTTCFPYALSGPLVRYEEMGPQLDALEVPQAEDLARGLGLMVLGLAKKVLLADSLAPAADAVFHAAAQGLPLSTAEAWLGALSYTFQIYFDFSGYTDMAVGAALMLGLRLPENFAAPYKATGIVDFWRRWHMTLGRWLHDCLYQPLGGSRHGRVRQYANLLLTMLVCGVWHGAGLTFLLWGGPARPAPAGQPRLPASAARQPGRARAGPAASAGPVRAGDLFVPDRGLGAVPRRGYGHGPACLAEHVPLERRPSPAPATGAGGPAARRPLGAPAVAAAAGRLRRHRLGPALQPACDAGPRRRQPSLAALAAEPALGRGSGPACAGLPAADAGPCLPFFPLLTEALMSEIAHPAPDGWLKRFFLSLVILALLAGLLLGPGVTGPSTWLKMAG